MLCVRNLSFLGNHENAPILTMSYGELKYSQTGVVTFIIDSAVIYGSHISRVRFLFVILMRGE